MRFFKDLSIRRKLTILFVIVSIIPICILSIISLNISLRTMTDKEVQDRISSLEFVEYKVSEIVELTHLDALRVVYDDSVRAYVDEMESIPENQLTQIKSTTKRKLMGYYSKDIASVLLIDKSGDALYYSPEDYMSVQEAHLYDQVPQNADEYFLFDSWEDAAWEGIEPVIPYIRIVIGKTSNEPEAFLVTNIKESVFNRIYLDYETSGNTTYFITNENGVIQSCTDKQNFGEYIFDVIDISQSELTETQGYLHGKYAGNQYIVTYVFDNQRGFYYYAITPMSEIISGFIPIIILTSILTLFCIVFCVLLGYWMSKGITKPLYKLINRIGTLGIKSESQTLSSNNELEILSNKYDVIIERLEDIINQYYEEQKRKKEAEIRALEFQINPHFLYNTLSTVIWLIEKDEKRKAIDITKKLSAFFRISISKGREYISIKEEITHVDLYVDIQKTRYGGTLYIEYDIPKKLKEYYTPKLVLQPLVENSIYHAMKKRVDKIGYIKIVGRFEGNDILLEVWDNGDKATQQTVEDMNRFLYNRTVSDNTKDYGIGISNVHDRIVMCFGSNYGLSYRREGESTVATIRIKAKTKE